MDAEKRFQRTEKFETWQKHSIYTCKLCFDLYVSVVIRIREWTVRILCHEFLQIQMYRHSMTQVIRILHEFVMREGIERCWNELVEYLSNSEITLDGLYISHLKYINKIIQRYECFSKYSTRCLLSASIIIG